jgi:PTH1 family peptidyl-tRNA hydrolase
MSYLIIALGNPGEKYKHTRHNAGWLVVNTIYPDVAWQSDSYAFADITNISDQLIIAKPMTFMNESGKTAEYFSSKKNIIPEHMIVVYDDIDLPLGKFKISFDRGSGGHNGIKSLESHLGSKSFIRIRIGISKLLEDGTFIKPNVLGNFESDEMNILEDVSKKIKYAIETILKEGKEIAMTEFNSDNPHIKLLKK